MDRASRVLAAIREDNLPDRFAAITTAATALHRLNLGDRTAVVDQLAEAAYGYGLEHDAIQVAIAMGSGAGQAEWREAAPSLLTECRTRQPGSLLTFAFSLSADAGRLGWPD